MLVAVEIAEEACVDVVDVVVVVVVVVKLEPAAHMKVVSLK